MPRKKNDQPAAAESATLTKVEAVRRALAELGKNAMPLQIQSFLKERLGVEMTVNHISNCKSEILRKSHKKKKGKGKTATPTATTAAATEVQPASQPRTAVKPAAGALNVPEIVITVKDLVSRLGADGLHSLIDALAR